MTRTIAVMLGALALFFLEAAGAQTNSTRSGRDWPTRPVRVVIPFPPGGNVDTFARVLFKYVEPELGQPIILDSRGGANSILGSDIVAKSSPDGYTFLHTSFGFAVNPAIVRKLPFDVEKDFIPVTNVALGTGYLMVINPSVPAKSVKELIAVAKQKPLRYSTAGVGNGQHLAGRSSPNAPASRCCTSRTRAAAPRSRQCWAARSTSTIPARRGDRDRLRRIGDHEV